MPVPDDLTDLERAVHVTLTAEREKAARLLADAECEAVKALYTAKPNGAWIDIDRIAAVLGLGKKALYARIDEANVPRRFRSKKNPMNGDTGAPSQDGVVSPRAGADLKAGGMHLPR